MSEVVLSSMELVSRFIFWSNCHFPTSSSSSESQVPSSYQKSLFVQRQELKATESKSKSRYNWRSVCQSVTQSVCQGIEPTLGLVTRYYLCCLCWAPSLTRVRVCLLSPILTTANLNKRVTRTWKETSTTTWRKHLMILCKHELTNLILLHRSSKYSPFLK
jgi:hypothetical protein